MRTQAAAELGNTKARAAYETHLPHDFWCLAESNTDMSRFINIRARVSLSRICCACLPPPRGHLGRQEDWHMIRIRGEVSMNSQHELTMGIKQREVARGQPHARMRQACERTDHGRDWILPRGMQL